MHHIKQFVSKNRVIFIAVLSVFLLLVIVQHVLYFSGIVFARNSVDAPLLFSAKKVASSKANQLSQTESVELAFTIDNETTTETIATKNAISLDENAFKKQLHHYSFKRLFIPFGGLIWPVGANAAEAAVLNQELNDSLAKLGEKKSIAPVNASLGAQEAALKIFPEKSGYVVDLSELKQAVAQEWSGEESTVVAEIVTPEIIAAELETVKEDVEVALSLPVAFTDGKTTTTIVDEQLVLASSIVIDPVLTTWSIDIEAIRSFFTPLLNDRYGVDDSPTIIERRDGLEVSRIPGRVGRTAKVTDELAQQISAFYTSGEKNNEPFSVEMIETLPAITFIDLSANTQENLQVLLNQLTGAYQASISVRQLYGGKWSVESGGDTQRIAASTYKLAVAHYVAAKVDSGEWQWTDPILSTTLEECVRRMLVVSDNDCPVELVYNRIGAQKMTAYTNGLGATQTCFGCDYTKSSTNDQLVFLQAIEQAQGISATSRERLLGYMAADIYRSGIPSATTYPLASKAGFILDVKNDSAIINTPQGPLLISIYTQGESWLAVREITSRILRQLEL